VRDTACDAGSVSTSEGSLERFVTSACSSL
jgi:hypothetical protein